MEFKKVLMVTSAAVALTAAGSAHAGDYFTVFGGASFQSDVDGSQTFTATNSGLTNIVALGSYYQFSSMTATFSQDLDSGFVLGAAYGRNFNRFWRAELEMTYRDFQVEDVMSVHEMGVFGVVGGGIATIDKYIYLTTTPTTQVTTNTVFSPGLFSNVSPGSYMVDVDADGSVSFFSIMANVWYDFNIAGPWETFIGAGIGMAQANANSITAQLVAPPAAYTRLAGYNVHFHKTSASHTGSEIYAYAPGYYNTLLDPVLDVDGSDWVFAYQFGVGAGYNLDNGVRLSAQYRYFGTDEAEIDGVGLKGEASEFLFGISFPLGN